MSVGSAQSNPWFLALRQNVTPLSNVLLSWENIQTVAQEGVELASQRMDRYVAPVPLDPIMGMMVSLYKDYGAWYYGSPEQIARAETFVNGLGVRALAQRLVEAQGDRDHWLKRQSTIPQPQPYGLYVSTRGSKIRPLF